MTPEKIKEGMAATEKLWRNIKGKESESGDQWWEWSEQFCWLKAEGDYRKFEFVKAVFLEGYWLSLTEEQYSKIFEIAGI